MTDDLLKYFEGQTTVKKIGAREVLLKEGQRSQQLFYVEKGCLRGWFNHEGNELTFQFVFEGQFVASFESFWDNQPSLYTIESIEPATLYVIRKKDFQHVIEKNPKVKDAFHAYVFKRLFAYQKLFIARITEKPEKRYLALLKNHPEILQRVPQHYIASFLGITPVSLSRIRSRMIP